MPPMMAAPLRSKSLDMVPLASSKKRARSDDDDEDVPRVEKKPRPFAFRTSPTSQHSLAFSQTKKPRPTSLFTPLVLPMVTDVETEEKRHSLPPRTPPRTKSSTKSGFSDAFSTFRDTADSDTDMPDSPMDISTSTTQWSSPATSPEDDVAPQLKRFANPPSGPPSPKSSRPYPMSPPLPRASRFALQPLSKSVNGQRLPTPTYGHFQPLSSRKDLNTPDVSPKTHSNKTAILRRGLPTLLPPSPISENEFESPTAGSMGDLLSRLQMSTSSSDKNSSEGDSPSRAKLGRRMAVDQGRGDQGQTLRGGKTTLAMGYRADCDKCLAKVPGHFNHVVKRI